MKKRILLFTALLLPGLIFLFLKKFGKNEFAVPVFHTGRMDSVNSACGTAYRSPYSVHDSVLMKMGWQQKPATVIIVDPAVDINTSALKDAFSDDEYQLIRPMTQGEPGSKRLACVFLQPEGISGVLLDKDKRIRGYYDLRRRQEMDRLTLEMDILLKKY